MSLFSMNGQVALITGSSRGIGKAIAEEMALQGAKVVISSRKQEACEAVAAELNARHGAGTAIAKAANISRKEDLQALVDAAHAAFGPCTALVCNAASNPYYGPSAGISDEQFRKILDNNILSNHWLIQMVLPAMAQRREGSVTIISSIAGIRANTAFGEQGAFGANGGQHGFALRAVHQLLGAAHRTGRQGVEALGHAPGMVQHLGGRQHGVGDAAFHRRLGREGVAQQQLFGRAALAHELRHQQAAGKFRHQPQADEGHGQAGVISHVDEIAMQQQGGANADGRPGDGCNHRFFAFEQRMHELEHRAFQRVTAALAGRALHEIIDVVARGEDARLAGDEHGAHRACGLRRAQRIGHGLVHGRGECVLLLGASDLDQRHAVVNAGLDGHVQTLSKIPAAPWPVPTHMVTMPYFRFLRRKA
ncbi:hypothetical protein B566_EDAN018434 [Ephemera danica]|nr:hypothetical protein B566_EDAN018434 [Ephemera danica]